MVRVLISTWIGPEYKVCLKSREDSGLLGPIYIEINLHQLIMEGKLVMERKQSPLFSYARYRLM